MTDIASSGRFLRRREDVPVLILSQDYELFFQVSGSIEKCLVDPCDMLLEFANKNELQITFYVDAGMLCCMQRLSAKHAGIGRQLTIIKNHIGTIVSAGHEIGLHVHPHWEETVWKNESWQFAGTRYQLRDYSDSDVAEIFRSYATALNELADGAVKSYRAGGFCVEPFGRIGNSLLENGISIDSSVVPGAVLKDADKGFDFSASPDQGWWQFSESPAIPDSCGKFIEIPVTPVSLPHFYYWGRLASRITGRRSSDRIGDGTSKAIGKFEVLRRLAGKGRVSELSIDAPKATQLLSRPIQRQKREIWHVMGHPKLLGPSSLDCLAQFIGRSAIRKSLTVAGLAAAMVPDEEGGE